MKDSIKKIGNTIIQHGKNNDRIYVISLALTDYPKIIAKLEALNKKHGYSKIFAKIPAACFPGFMQSGYRIEAYIPKYYRDNDDALFLAKYYSKKRQQISNKDLDRFQNIFEKEAAKSLPTIEKGYSIQEAGYKDVKHMASLYKKVFKSYPFPIHNPEYLLKTMGKNIIYFSAWKERQLIGLSSSEIDQKNKSAEMTDFAVAPNHRNKSIGSALLCQMESKAKEAGLKRVFTIARLKSIGINRIFYNAGYNYSGTLINNTNISGSLESMNVWYKHL